MLAGHVREDARSLIGDQFQFVNRTHQRDHDLGTGVAAETLAEARGLRDGTHLQREQPRDHQAQSHTAQTQHRVRLVQTSHRAQQSQVGLVRLALLLGHGHPNGQFGEVGQELVQGRVDQPDRHRQPVHDLEDADEVLTLQRQQCCQCGLPLRVVFGEDELLDVLLAVAEEHVFRAAQANALATHAPTARGVVGGIGIRTHRQPSVFVGVAHDAVDGVDQFRGLLIRAVQGGVDAGVEVLNDR